MKCFKLTNVDCCNLPFFTTSIVNQIYMHLICTNPDNWCVKRPRRSPFADYLVVFYRPFKSSPYKPFFICFQYSVDEYVDDNGCFLK